MNIIPVVVWQLQVFNQKIPKLKQISNKLEHFKVRIKIKYIASSFF